MSSGLPLQGKHAQAFTLLEALVATAVFALLLTLLLSVTSNASKIWQQSESQKIRRQTARTLIETITRDLEATTFPLDKTAQNNIELSVNPSGLPANYLNKDAAFWQAPIPGEGKHGDMHDVGYFVRWVDNKSELCRLRMSATNVSSIFNRPSSELTAALLDAEAPGSLNPTTYKGLLADNVIALWMTFYTSNNVVIPTPYSSRNPGTYGLPAYADVALVVASSSAMNFLTEAKVKTFMNRSTVEQFLNDLSSDPSLPDTMKGELQLFKTRVRLEASK